MMHRIFVLFVLFAMRAHQTLLWNVPVPLNFSFKLEEHRLRINCKSWTGSRRNSPIILKKIWDSSRLSQFRHGFAFTPSDISSQ